LNIAQAIFERPDILLLDEPTNALDEKSVAMIYQLLREERERGATIIMATHHREDIAAICDHTFQISGGRLLDSVREGRSH
jgi:ABC-2 type transport system ATP-binding protein